MKNLIFCLGGYALFGFALYFGIDSSLTRSTEIHCAGDPVACEYLKEG